MRWLFPKFSLARLPAMLCLAALGAACAATYGAIHDQISFALSPEYFTKLKFRQFAWADCDLPPRAFASEVGALATWWVGLIAGWFLARSGLAEMPAGARRRHALRAFGIVAVAAPLGGFIGWALGAHATNGDLSAWSDWQEVLELEDLSGFVVVAHLHAGGYIGALVGLVLAVVYVRRALRG